MTIEKLENQGEKTVYACPLCGSEYNNYSDAENCLTECATAPHEVEEKTVKGDLYICSECQKEFNTLEEAERHPLNCLLIIAAAHPSQTKLVEDQKERKNE
jgi:DNA-directed RNA polymerase subunit RPC12/RpoP